MKNVILLETHEEIMNAYMHADLPKLGLYVPAPANTPNETEAEKEVKSEIGSIYDGDICCGINDEGKQLFVYKSDADEELTWDNGKKFCEELAKKTGKAYRMPTLKELMLMFIHKDKLNEGLKKAGGEPLKDDCYWSSTENDSNNSWELYVSNGDNYYYSKIGNYYVRPVLAF